MDLAFAVPQGQEVAPAIVMQRGEVSNVVGNNLPGPRRRPASPMRRATGVVDKTVKAMSSELMDTLVWPEGMGPQVKQVWVRLLAQVLVPIHAAMRHTGENGFSDMVTREAVLERTDKDDLSDSLPLQDLTARIVTLEERISNLELRVFQAGVPSGEGHVSAASQSSCVEQHAEGDVKRAQRTAARRHRSPSPLVRPVHDHGTGNYMLLPQSAVSELLAAGVIEEEIGGGLVKYPLLWQQPQHHQEAPDMQVQPQMQTQTAPQMMDAGPQLQPHLQPQMQPPYMLVAGCGPTVAAVGQQLQPHMLVAGQQLQPHMQLQYWWPCQSVPEGTHGSGLTL